MNEGKQMKNLLLAIFAIALTFSFTGTSSAQNKMMKSGNPTVGGAAMYKTKNIVENAVNSPIHTTLVAAVKAAGLVETLSGKGPFTVFAPENSAFAALPDGTVASLLKPENKDMLTKVLTYHVVAGKYDSKKIMKAIKNGNGRAMLTTVSGDNLDGADGREEPILPMKKAEDQQLRSPTLNSRTAIFTALIQF